MVDNNDLNLIRDGGYESVMLVVNSIGRGVLSSRILSIKQAYQMIVDEAPKEFDRAELLYINIDQYISDKRRIRHRGANKRRRHCFSRFLLRKEWCKRAKK
ncbi:hypothetical protein MASR1M31_08070 [Porphyromonadaceae bacterium]